MRLKISPPNACDSISMQPASVNLRPAKQMAHLPKIPEIDPLPRLQASGSQASGFRLQAPGFRLQASGSRLQVGIRSQIPDSGS